MINRALALLAVLAALAYAAWIVVAPRATPRLTIDNLAQLPIVAPAPYDEKANADAAVAAAFVRARQSHKQVLIDLGGNWCPDCIVLANVMRLPEMKPFLAAHYEIAVINVGRFDTNLQIPARFGLTKRLKGVPTVLIATPEGTLLNRGDTYALSDDSSMKPQAIADWLAKWAN